MDTFPKKERNEYPVIKNFTSSPVGIDGNAHFQVNPGNKTIIPTSYAVSMRTTHNRCNFTALICSNKQDGLWADRGLYDNCTAHRINPHPMKGLELIMG